MIPIARPIIGEEERTAVDAVLASGQLAQGPQVDAFEHEFVTYLATQRQAVAVGSGTSALHLGLLAAGVGPGDEVLVPSFSFAASANAIRLAGATPVFVDIAPHDLNLDPRAVEAAIGPRSAAIMAVHLYGHPAPMAELRTLADANGLLLLEDAAQAHGATLHGRHVGTLGDLAAFSFYPTKNMTTGEGGMIIAADAQVARRARLLRNQGMELRYVNEIVGFNARMTDVAAAIGRVQLRHLPDWLASRRAHARRLDERLRDVVRVPEVSRGVEHAYHQYTVKTEDREVMEAKLTRADVGYGIYYPIPIHRLPAYDLDLDLPETARACGEVLSLPVHPALSDDEVESVAQAVCA